MDTQLLLSIVQIVSVSLMPLIVWIIGVNYQNRKSKKQAQLNLFLTLMANRKTNPITREWVDALNSIDVVFQDNKKVRAAWREYLDSLDQKSSHFQNANAYMLDLLSEMAEALGYKQLRQTEIDRFYVPVYFGSQQSQQDILIKEQIRVLMHSKSEAESFSEEEYAENERKVWGNKGNKV